MLGILVTVLCLIVTLLLLLDFYVRNYTTYKIAKSLQGPPMLPIIGSTAFLFHPREEMFQVFTDMCSRYKNGFAFWFCGIFSYSIYSADSVEKILTNPKHIEKARTYKLIRPLLGTGLLTSSGEKWFARRKLLTPTFHFNILNGFQLKFSERTKNLLNEIREKELNKPNGTHLGKLISLYTLNNICESAMDMKSLKIDELDNYRHQIQKVSELQLRRLGKPWWYNDWLYFTFGKGRMEKQFINEAHSFTERIIATKRKLFLSDRNQRMNNNESKAESGDIGYEKKRRLAMLDTLLIAEQNQQIDSAGIQEEVTTFIFGGNDTTMTSIKFTLFAIANHEDVQNRLYEEIASMGEDPNYNQLKYLDAVIKESLRMFPPGPNIGRILGEDTVIDGVKFPSGSTVHIIIHKLHRDPKYFPNPDDFNPDRFLETKMRNPFAYIPFSAGQRNCQKYAMMQMRTMIGEIVKNFELKPITKPEDVYIILNIVFKPKDPIRVRFVERKLKK